MPKPNFKNPTTFEDVMSLIEISLSQFYDLGLDQEERLGDFERIMKKTKKEISDMVDQFFLDNR